MPDRRPLRQIPALDGLRALAVLLVVGFHLSPGVVPGGWIGVDIFFVLSGWLITTLLLNEHAVRGGVDFGAFYQRRAVRLMPALAIMLVFASAVVIFDAHVRGFAWDALCSLTYTFDFRVLAIHHGTPVSHTWSLGVEEQFYLAWPPLLVWWLGRGRRAWPLAVAGAAAALIVSAVVAVTVGTRALTFTPLGHTVELLIGAAAALVPLRVPTTLAWLTLPTVVAVALTVGDGARWEYEGGLALLALLTAALIRHLAERPSVLARGLALSPAQWLGRRSYGVYLYHFPMIWLIGRHVPGHQGQVVIVAATLALAAISYRWVEQPFLRRKRYAVTTAGSAERLPLPPTAVRPQSSPSVRR